MINVRPYIGKPWACPCNPPKSYDCWEFLRVVRESVGLITPIYVPTDERVVHYADLFKHPPEGWYRLSKPNEGCAAAMTVGSGHVGVYIGNDTIAHAWSQDGKVGGVRIDSVRLLQRLHSRLEFWDYHA